MSVPADPLQYFPEETWEPLTAPCLEVHLANGTQRDTAYIATDLKELADSGVRAGTIVSVVGYDLPSVEDLNYLWLKEVLPEWMRRGAKVRYFAVNPSPIAQENLRNLAKQFPAGALEARTLPPSLAEHSHEAKLAQLWKHFHFATFANERQLWVELNHPPGSKEAYDCKHFNSQQTVDLPLYEKCLSDFDLMFAKGRDFLA